MKRPQLRTQHVGGRILISQGVVAEGPAFILAALGAVKRFSDFNEFNDPYGEHDFGVVSVEADKVFWKIDYYDHSLTAAADPASESDCVRVLKQVNSLGACALRKSDITHQSRRDD